ncbi:MAG TPA: cation diffusion facilitator family transporter [Acidimicrobiales bacterium]
MERPTRHGTGHHDHRDTDHRDTDHRNTVHRDTNHRDAPADAHRHRRGLAGWVAALALPHDHGAHSGERVLETTSAGIRAVALSLGILATTAAVELVVAILSHSVALLADTIHNFADALTAAPLALAFKMGRRAPTRRYTYGFGRAEDLAGVAIVAIIAASAAVAATEAVNRLLHPRPISGAGWVMAAGVVGFLGNELVAMYRVHVGRRIGSAALVADGLHARTDGFTSLAVVVGAIAVVAGAPRADPIVGVVITAAVTVVLVGATRTIYRRLMDSVDPALVDQVEDVLAHVPGVDGVDDVRIRWVGHELRAEIQISSDPALSLVDAHAIAEEAHHRLLHDVARLAEAVIHTSPTGSPGHGAPNYHEAVEHHFTPPPSHEHGPRPHDPPAESP